MKILVVDDDATLLLRLQEYLQLQGHNVVLAHDGRQALHALFDHDDLDVVITDMKMPQSNGIEVLQAVWAKGKLPCLLHSTEAMGYVNRDNGREQIDLKNTIGEYFDFAEFHLKKSDFSYIEDFLARVATRT